MARNTRTQIKHLTVSAMLCALGVIVLALGSFIEVIDASVAVIASLLTVYAVIEIGGAYPWMIWLVTSVVSFLLIPAKSPVLFYAFLAGYYPILKEKIERRFSRLTEWLCKAGILVGACALIYLAARFFLPALLEGYEGIPMLLLLFGLTAVVFVLYDYCLSQLITFYLLRLRHRFRLK